MVFGEFITEDSSGPPFFLSYSHESYTKYLIIIFF